MKLTGRHVVTQVHKKDATVSLFLLDAQGRRTLAVENCPLLVERDRKTDRCRPVGGTFDAAGSGVLFRSTGARPAELTLALADDVLTLTLVEPPVPGESLPARMRWCLEQPVLQVLPGLWAVGPAEEGSGLALPVREGVWIPAGSLPIRETVKASHVLGLAMGFWAACHKSTGSVIGLTEHAYLEFLADGGAHGLRWTPELLRDPESISLEMRISLIEGDSAIAAAQEYRRIEQPHRKVAPLTERAMASGTLANLVGGANIKFVQYIHREPSSGGHDHVARDEAFTKVHRFEDVARICRELKAAGIDRAMAIFWGWGVDGYDRLHPDFLPANAWAGGDEGLRRASDEIRRLGYSVGGHDNYQDIYQSAPSFGRGESVCGRVDGSLNEGGFWAGGRCYIQCSAEANRFARRNLPEMKQRYGWDAIFIDTTTAAQLYECYSDAHPRSREDDRRDKRWLMDYSRNVFGAIGSETGMSWSLEHLDYWEGILADRADKGNWWWYSRLLRGVEIPLFAVIYRDVQLGYPHQSQGLRADAPDLFLTALRSAQPPYYFFDQGFYPAGLEYLKKTYQVLAYLHRYTAGELLCEHEWLRPDGRIERTALTDGTQIVTNNTSEPFELEVSGVRVRLCAHGWFVRSPRLAGFWAQRVDGIPFDPPLWAVVRREDDGSLVVSADGPLSPDGERALKGLLTFPCG